MAMRDADKDRRKETPTKKHLIEPVSTHELKQLLMTARAQRDQWQQRAKDNEEAASQLTQVQQEIDELKERAAQTYQVYLNEQKNYQQTLVLYNEEKARATQLVAQRDEWQQRAVTNESQLVHVKQDVETYQVEMNELKQRAALNYQKYLDEQKNSQKTLHDYHEAKAKATELIAQRDELQKRGQENQKVAYELIQVQLDLKIHQIKVNDLEESAAQNHQKYLDEQKNYQEAVARYNEEKARATQLVAQRDEWQQRAVTNESQLVHVKQDVETYQVEMNELKQRAALNYQKYLDEQKNSQKTLHDYHEAKAKTTELIAQRDELQKRAAENQKAAYELIQVQLDLQTYQVKVNDLEESAAKNYQKYLNEQKNYQEALASYNEEKARASELLAKYEEVSSERDNYLTLYNEAQTQLKFERRSKASIKGWETRRKAENEKLKREIAEMVVLLRDSLVSKDEAINNLYVVAERMDKIQSLVDSVEEDTTNNPVGLVQKFQRIWFAIKEILSE
ncbi:hypothetical protein [Dulcicalothrix desertica]|uniref:hypothetical protein n=1 Tax=Dulcicalothrix desertica TaxID=32056 RepID=UPI001199A990|nr:hypothetical protein [Dulcicalothrix desertica]TWH40028.1 hypothetical protein CAL7102_09316 [Dulcicalothrix desertica PCC 7102]